MEGCYNHWHKKVQVKDKSQDMQVTLDQELRKSLKPNQNDEQNLLNIISRNFWVFPKKSESPSEIGFLLR